MSFFLNLFGLSSPPKRPSDKPATDAAPPDDSASPTQVHPEGTAPSPGAIDAPVAAPEVPIAKKIHGFVDVFQPPGVVIGWALDDANPNAPLAIRVLVSGQEIAAGVTTFQRPDLKWAPDNTAGYRIDTHSSIDPKQFLNGSVQVLADSYSLVIGRHLIELLKTERSSP